MKNQLAAIGLFFLAPWACGGAMVQPATEPVHEPSAAGAPSSSAAPASDSPPATAPSATAPAKAACDPAAFVKSDQAPASKSLGDLDGDGQDETEIDVASKGVHIMFVLQPQPAPTCFRKVFDGTKVTITAITVGTTKTHGWLDLNVDELMPGVSHGGQMTPDQTMTFVAKYDGKKYVLE